MRAIVKDQIAGGSGFGVQEQKQMLKQRLQAIIINYTAQHVIALTERTGSEVCKERVKARAKSKTWSGATQRDEAADGEREVEDEARADGRDEPSILRVGWTRQSDAQRGPRTIRWTCN